MGMQNIDQSSTILDKKDADILHSIVAKLLWVSKRERPDIDPVISFLCTIVTNSINKDMENRGEY